MIELYLKFCFEWSNVVLYKWVGINFIRWNFVLKNKILLNEECIYGWGVGYEKKFLFCKKWGKSVECK